MSSFKSENLSNLKNKPAHKAMRSIAGRKICILGLGIENQALVEFLVKKKVNCEITICDARKEAKKDTKFSAGNLVLGRVNWRLGKNYDKNLKQFDIVFRVAGYPLFNLTPNPSPSKGEGSKASSPTKLFFDLCPTKNIIGVTGTKGKGTTSSLIYEILKQAGKRVHFGGNIGTPMFSFLDKIKKNDWVVLELSSFQLEDLHKSPQIAVITNFTPEHLVAADPVNPNFHRSIADYWKAKSNIFAHQKRPDKLVISYKLLVKKRKNIKTSGRIISFTKSDLPSKLVGEYNKENIAAAVSVAKIAGVKDDIIRQAVKNFKGLPHRIEFVKKIKGISYYDNSFATTPEATILDLKSFHEPIILLLGGADKGADFKELAKAVKGRAKFIVLLDGQSTPRIKKELLKVKFPKEQMKLVKSMKEAVKSAKKETVAGDIILLSTACASFGMFKNYKERGEMFKAEVAKIS
ncbi:UDP-N-acetylmuramoyl-L-alanine--D-glutamate ligase [Candidatus Falkowbacteria bacterium CG11_big_fil_rev_8_21_14_0_20_39_10]|uniref:UDP-N-acetylmuramoylalanine--D-glutamate ligase n=1 Tax=Candidatus Falkowbacteria bacterium CG11_big_fil_rev_8_21_14_0_20_39_10 TaxID=1974570 RepID=A0A2M6K8M9_9BACT|nr:MAG: UDP-N-acetylmuramoyl-L-alanine--D-glutamate ligase [Candidatus Falkowbacteria bacterium CG11_big_fil_rev_8_21_14_0_20_39_10]